MTSTKEMADAAELFGVDALRDERSLKRAYAKLLRQFGPENDPAAFQRIRAAYEAARAALAEGRAAEEAAPARWGAEPRAGAPSATEDVERILAALDDESWAESSARARALALEEAETGALELAVAMAFAESPRAVATLLVEVTASGRGARAAGLLQRTVGRDPRVAAEPIEPVLDAVRARPEALELVALCVDACLAEEQHERATAIFRRYEPELRSARSGLWAHLLEAILLDAPAALCAAELDDALTFAEAPSSGLEDDVYWLLVRRVTDAGALVEAGRDAQVPPGVAIALGRSIASPPFLVFQALRHAADELTRPVPGLSRYGSHVEYIEAHHPALLRMMRDALDVVSGGRAFVAEWAEKGSPPGSAPRALGAVLGALGSRSGVFAQPDDGDVPEDDRPSEAPTWIGLAALIAFVGSVGWGAAQALYTHVTQVASLLIAGLSVAIMFWAFVAARREKDRKKLAGAWRIATSAQSAVPALESRDANFAKLRAAQSATGAWAHEVCAAATRIVGADRDLVASYAEVIDVDLRALHDNHLKRLLNIVRTGGPKE